MKKFKRAAALVVSASLMAITASRSNAAVSLLLTDNDPTPNSTTVSKGGTFPVSVKLSSSSSGSSDQATGLDYLLQQSAGPTANAFTITSRNTTTSGSAFPDTFSSDAAVSGQVLAPRNASDLGGTVSNVNVPVSNGTFEVADYVLSVSATALPGIYTITTFSNPGTGYTGNAASGFADTPFASAGTFTVTVTPTPEPASLAVFGVIGTSLLMRRRAMIRRDR